MAGTYSNGRSALWGRVAGAVSLLAALLTIFSFFTEIPSLRKANEVCSNLQVDTGMVVVLTCGALSSPRAAYRGLIKQKFTFPPHKNLRPAYLGGQMLMLSILSIALTLFMLSQDEVFDRLSVKTILLGALILALISATGGTLEFFVRDLPYFEDDGLIGILCRITSGALLGGLILGASALLAKSLLRVK